MECRIVFCAFPGREIERWSVRPQLGNGRPGQPKNLRPACLVNLNGFHRRFRMNLEAGKVQEACAAGNGEYESKRMAPKRSKPRPGNAGRGLMWFLISAPCF
jgi:hypothetical protein